MKILSSVHSGYLYYLPVLGKISIFFYGLSWPRNTFVFKFYLLIDSQMKITLNNIELAFMPLLGCANFSIFFSHLFIYPIFSQFSTLLRTDILENQQLWCRLILCFNSISLLFNLIFYLVAQTRYAWQLYLVKFLSLVAQLNYSIFRTLCAVWVRLAFT